ncbi:MAG TPA: UDP-N-acetylmuramoyl-L-alanine--D-glutamate ligase [Saprospiraceae bacterium]|nr:UDP-N-acetylmuramoyl-L-alanine--D-glutamate ligase [Saprospiraceae bacterium]
MKVVILGGGESGVGSALLSMSKGYPTFLSDAGAIQEKFKQELIEAGIEFEENGHTESKILDAVILIKSPGIPDKVEIISKFKQQGGQVISEIEFASQFTAAKIIGITGSNGKTTTTKLIDHIMNHAALSVKMAGNIGKSFARILVEEDPEYFVLELSSFQLDDIIKFKPYISVLLNITPDHLDRYDYQFENYVHSKFRITANQTQDDLFIYNANDSAIISFLENENISAQLYGIQEIINSEGFIKVDNFSVHKSKVSIKGPHNEFNAACAIKVALHFGIEHHIIKEALASFINLPHRLEMVDSINGVSFINDSKATNVDATFYGLSAMDGPTIWVVGGTDKGNDYTVLNEQVQAKVKAIVCLGADNHKIIDHFARQVDMIAETRTAQNAVKTAFSLAVPGDVVLLSPACASFDLFNNYEDRGDQFKEAVKHLKLKVEH